VKRRREKYLVYSDPLAAASNFRDNELRFEHWLDFRICNCSRDKYTKISDKVIVPHGSRAGRKEEASRARRYSAGVCSPFDRAGISLRVGGEENAAIRSLECPPGDGEQTYDIFPSTGIIGYANNGPLYGADTSEPE